jgi:hypothetical protein
MSSPNSTSSRKTNKNKSKSKKEEIDYSGLDDLFKPASTRRSTRVRTHRSEKIRTPTIEINNRDVIAKKYIDEELELRAAQSEIRQNKKCELILLHIKYLESIVEIQNKMFTYFGGSGKSSLHCLKELPQHIYNKYQAFIDEQKKKTISVLRNELIDIIILRENLIQELEQNEKEKEQEQIHQEKPTKKSSKHKNTRKKRRSPQNSQVV